MNLNEKLNMNTDNFDSYSLISSDVVLPDKLPYGVNVNELIYVKGVWYQSQHYKKRDGMIYKNNK